MTDSHLTDIIVQEVRRAREAYAQHFNYDLESIFADIARQQEDSGREFVTLPAKRLSTGETAER